MEYPDTNFVSSDAETVIFNDTMDEENSQHNSFSEYDENVSVLLK